MTLCPIALVAGCAKCPAFRICPVKGTLGDYKPAPPEVKADASSKAGAKKKR